MENAQNIDSTVSVIDKAIAAAKARAAAKSSRTDNDPKPSKEDRAELRQQAKAAREAAKAQKKAAKAASRTAPVHMTKVEKAASRLPELGSSAKETFDEVTTNLSAQQLVALSLHLQHFNRVNATIKATSAAPLKVGQVVRITGGDPKYIGMTGVLEKVQRIRCYASVKGVKRPVYLFTSDVEVLDEAGSEAPKPDQDVGDLPIAAEG